MLSLDFSLLLHDHILIRYLKEKEAILNGDANDNDNNRGNQLIGPCCLQGVLRGVN